METVPQLPTPGPRAFREAHRALLKAFEPYRAFCGWVDGPFGRVWLARTNQGLSRVSFRNSEGAFLDELEHRALLPAIAPEKLDRERRELDEYFEGKRRGFDVPVDVRWGTPFEHEVLDAARKIPFGCCERYRDVADRIGRPKAYRAVGNALGKNPVAIVIPCHRVVASRGKLGGYTGGLDIKKTLMDIEGIEIGDKV